MGEKIGLLDENLRQHWSDQELDDRLHKLNIPIKEINSVIVYHEQAQTVSQMTKELMPDDEQSYKSVR